MSEKILSTTEKYAVAAQVEAGMPLSHAEIMTQPARAENGMPWDPRDLSAPEQPEATA